MWVSHPDLEFGHSGTVVSMLGRDFLKHAPPKNIRLALDWHKERSEKREARNKQTARASFMTCFSMGEPLPAAYPTDVTLDYLRRCNETTLNKSLTEPYRREKFEWEKGLVSGTTKGSASVTTKKPCIIASHPVA